MAPTESKDVDNKVVQSAIVSTLATFLSGQDATFIRPNKLRKMICRKVPGATWTQFAECLQVVLKNEKEHGFRMDGKDETIIRAGDPTTKATALTTTIPNPTNDKVVIATKNIQVPRAIALHLTRKGYTKKHNIEINTKTKLTLHGIGRASEGLPLNELVTIQIDRYSLTTEEDETESARKHIKTAQLLLEKMAKSYKQFPDRFAPRKAGGTLEEQKKHQLVVAAKQANRTDRKGKDSKSKTIPVKRAETSKTSKRKKEKFY